MTTALKGLNRDQALAVFARIHAMLTTEPDGAEQTAELGKLAVLSGVWEYPTRVKCATLAWQTLRRALTETVDGPGKSR
jgi:nitrogen fixation NifU-like protein